MIFSIKSLSQKNSIKNNLFTFSRINLIVRMFITNLYTYLKYLGGTKNEMANASTQANWQWFNPQSLNNVYSKG